MNNILVFLKEVRSEIFKITWPGRDDLVGSIIIVCLLTLVTAALLGGMDAVFSIVLRKVIS